MTLPLAAAIEGYAEDIWAAWHALSRGAGSFLGIHCPTGAAVQFMWDESDLITIALPSPTKGGSMTKISSFEECGGVIIDICAGGDPEKIQSLEFVKW